MKRDGGFVMLGEWLVWRDLIENTFICPYIVIELNESRFVVTNI